MILSATESARLDLPELAGLLVLDASGLLAIGLLGGLLLRYGGRLVGGGRAAIGLAFGGLFGLGLGVMRDDALGMAEELAGGPQLGLLLFAGIVAAVAGAVVVAALVGRRLRGRGVAWLGLLSGLGALALNHFVLVGDFPSAHLYVAFAGLALAGGSLTGAAWPGWIPPRRRRGLGWSLWMVAAVATATLATLRPSMEVVLHQLRFAGSVMAPYVTRARAERASFGGGLPSEWGPWFRDRAALPSIAAGPPILGARPPIVILWTIDSLRADVLLGGEYDARLPNLAALRDRSFTFTEARAPGSQTVVTFTSIFAGTYYSSQDWSKHPGIRDLWPDDDDGSVRFPELLREAGVTTVNLAAARWLTGPFGVVRGFSDEAFVPPKGTHFTVASRILPELRERLEAIGDRPLFAFVHALDAHSSTRPRKRHKDPWERYIDNLALVDEGLGSLLAMIEELELAERTILIISSDHGEAFGEHGVTAHGRTLYDELLRVPLLIDVPGAGEGRRIATPVSLMDLGPTILDIFGAPTPAAHLGESLVPALRGQELAPTRPIIAEGRLKKSLIFPDGRKLIVDDRLHTTELYDLHTDPQELENLVDRDDEEVARRISILREFFSIHRNKREGYEVPYRK